MVGINYFSDLPGPTYTVPIGNGPVLLPSENDPTGKMILCQAFGAEPDCQEHFHGVNLSAHWHDWHRHSQACSGLYAWEKVDPPLAFPA